MIRCIWEHNGQDTLLHAIDYPGAYTRGGSFDEAAAKMPGEIASWLRWAGREEPVPVGIAVVEDIACTLKVQDADSDVLFESERAPLSIDEYHALKSLALRSAADFHALYQSITDPDRTALAPRETFYGAVPRTAREMYAHTRNVNSYYFGEIGVDIGNDGDILSCRERGFEVLECMPDFLSQPACEGSWGEWWSLRKVLRRFLWHDRIHARAMVRMAKATFGICDDPFCFDR